MLLERKADPAATDRRGMTAAEMCKGRHAAEHPAACSPDCVAAPGGGSARVGLVDRQARLQPTHPAQVKPPHLPLP